jgi:hypothetical protein
MFAPGNSALTVTAPSGASAWSRDAVADIAVQMNAALSSRER